MFGVSHIGAIYIKFFLWLETKYLEAPSNWNCLRLWSCFNFFYWSKWAKNTIYDKNCQLENCFLNHNKPQIGFSRRCVNYNPMCFLALPQMYIRLALCFCRKFYHKKNVFTIDRQLSFNQVTKLTYFFLLIFIVKNLYFCLP